MQSGYTEYFGLTEIPFSIAPNPHYLFMSERHKEALAHLTYGLGEAGGFVLLTGEVGTGKTTVSKCLLEQLPNNTEAAFILNPTLSAAELLATICDEFHIQYDNNNATLKTYTDSILNYLLSNHQQAKNTLLIIDEAQHLQAEVLEQLRLLTNLETHTKKLLQVILIGQPELQELLKRRDLRQLAQRITARYHLLPLNKAQVSHYIQHRLAVAGCQRALFNAGAITLIHQLSNGVPRLINLLCDRALLGAYGQEQKVVDKKIVQQACSEALGHEHLPLHFWQYPRFKQAAMVMATVLAVTFGFNVAEQQQYQLQQTDLNIAEALQLQRNEQQLRKLNQLPNQLINQSRQLNVAFTGLFKAWQVQLIAGQSKPCEVASDYQLECYWYAGSSDGFIALDHPGIVRFIDGKGQAFFATYLGPVNNNMQLLLNETVYEVSREWFADNWQGSAATLWRPPAGFIDKIDQDSSVELLSWLEHNLSKYQQRATRQVETFDPLLINQLQQFQQQPGLEIKSYADLSTVLLLTNADANYLGDLH